MALLAQETRRFPSRRHDRISWPGGLWGCLIMAIAAAVIAVAGGVRAGSVKAASATEVVDFSQEVKRIKVTQNKSRTLKLPKPFASAVVGDPKTADALPMSDRVVYIQGKKPGTTNISLFDKDKQLLTIIDVDVTIDTEHITRNIRTSLESTGIRVTSSNSQVVLSGVAKDAPDAERAVAIAKAMAPEVVVINAMKVAPSQQVMLKVRYLEVDRHAAREIGVNWFGANTAGNRGINTGRGEPAALGRDPAGLPIIKSASTFASGGTTEPFAVAIANLLSNGTTLDVMISALETKGLVRALAEPDLVALSGDTASFLAGGEIPVPTVQPTTGTITTEYKPFGVQLAFVPTVLGNGIINLRLSPSVSQLDYTNAIISANFRVPAISKRETHTTIELRDGQSFAISGLLQSEGLRDISQMPWLGSVPVLGSLFRSSSYQQKETDLVVIVTAHLVQPAAPGQQLASPLDQRMPGNDVDFFLNGQSDMRKKYSEFVTAGSGIKGPYGHIMPLNSK